MKLKNLSKSLIVFMLCVSMVGCSANQFVTVLNEVAPAVLNILEIVAIFKGVPVDPNIPNRIQTDVTLLEKLYTDYQTATGTSQAGIRNEINAAFSVLNSDIASVLTIAQVSDKNTQLKVTALVGLVQTAVLIAEAAIPSPASAAQAVTPISLNASGFVDSYNKILTAKTGNSAVDKYTSSHKIHIHSKLVRAVTLGQAK